MYDRWKDEQPVGRGAQVGRKYTQVSRWGGWEGRGVGVAEE